MNTLNSLNAYRSHDLSISMKTSSGDVINLDFANEQSMNMKNSKNDNSSESSLKFSSMQAFQFTMESNGLDEQDKKEIAAFMELAQPKIDSFIKELADNSQKSSVSKVAKDITNMLSNIDEKSADFKNYAKDSVVNMFDNSLEKEQKNINSNKQATTQELVKLNEKPVIDFEKLFEESQKLLEKILQEMDSTTKSLYA